MSFPNTTFTVVKVQANKKINAGMEGKPVVELSQDAMFQLSGMR